MMLRLLLILALLGGFMVTCVGQNPQDSLKVGGRKFNPKITQNEQELDLYELDSLCEGNQEASRYLRKANTNHAISNVLGVLSGGAIGFSFVTILTEQPNWVLAGSGVGLFIVSIPFTAWYSTNVRKVARSFNSRLDSRASSGEPNISWGIAFSERGVGLQLRF